MFLGSTAQHFSDIDFRWPLTVRPVKPPSAEEATEAWHADSSLEIPIFLTEQTLGVDGSCTVSLPALHACGAARRLRRGSQDQPAIPELNHCRNSTTRDPGIRIVGAEAEPGGPARGVQKQTFKIVLEGQMPGASRTCRGRACWRWGRLGSSRRYARSRGRPCSRAQSVLFR